MKLRDHLKPYKELIAKLKLENRKLKSKNWFMYAECRLWETRHKFLKRDLAKLQKEAKWIN